MNKYVSSFLVAMVLIAPEFSFGDSELTGPECMPGFNATLAKVRAVQRASSCSLTGNLSDCKVQMGVGALAIGAAAAAKGTGLGSKAAQAIRDISSRPCPYVASRNSLSFLLLDSAVAAGCTPQIEIERARVQNSMDIIAEELAKKKQQAESALRAMEQASQDIAKAASTTERDAKIAEIAKKSVADAKAATEQSYRAYSAARNQMGYERLAGQEADATRLKESKLFEFRKAFRNYFGVAFDDNELYNLDEMSKRLQPGQKQNLDELRATLKEASTAEFQARSAIRDIDHDPNIQRLNKAWDATNRNSVELMQLSRNPSEYAATLNARTAELKAQIGTLAKSEAAMADFKAALAATKSPQDIYTLASRLHNFIPKEVLLDPAKAAISTALKEASAVANRVISMGGKVTEPVLSLLSKYPALAELAAGSRVVGSLVLRGVALTGGLLVSGLTFAGNDMQKNTCGDMTKSVIFPRDPEKGCSQDLSPDSATARKIFEMEPSAMCQLMKENPEVKSMVESNYFQAYPQTRAQCGNPMTFAIEGRGQVSYDGKTAKVLRTGETRETIVEFDANGNESAIKVPKTIRGGGYETLKAGETPSYSSGDNFDRFTHDYRTQVLPMIAEASACCSDTGVAPTASECSRYGIRSSPTRPNSTGTGARVSQ